MSLTSVFGDMGAYGAGRMDGARAAAGVGTPSAHPEDIKRLEAMVQKLSLVNRAMWELVRDNTSLTDQHLLDKVEEIDLRDGKRDGKVGTPQKATCMKCGKVLQRGQNKCLYCGTIQEFDSAFDAVR